MRDKLDRFTLTNFYLQLFYFNRSLIFASKAVTYPSGAPHPSW
jgi:hypothetical protein